jgi:hypothetical protein
MLNYATIESSMAWLMNQDTGINNGLD